MFQLNENSMKRIMREEYMKRLKQFLSEEIDIEYGKGVNKINLINNAQGLKVRHDETGLEYTIFNYDEAAGNVILLLPDQSRLNEKLPSTNKLIEADVDNDGIPDEIDNDISDLKQMISKSNDLDKLNRKKSVEKVNLLNYDKNKTDTKKANNKKYMVVSVADFIKNYSL